MAHQFGYKSYLISDSKSKTRQLTFEREQQEVTGLPDINMHNNTKFLEITINENNYCGSHIDNLSNKLSTRFKKEK